MANFRQDLRFELCFINGEGDFGNDPVEEGMRLFRIAGAIDSRIEPVPISVESFEKDTWLPLIYEIRKKGIEVYPNNLSSLI